MKILIIGGTRYFGKHTVEKLLAEGHEVTIATRGRTPDDFGDRVKRLVLDRQDPVSVKKAVGDMYFDVLIDKVAYGSNDIPPVLDNIRCGRYVQMSTTSVYEKKHMDTREEEYDPSSYGIVWCWRNDYDYGETKRQAEAVIVQKYPKIPSVMVRYPFVIGMDDYSKRMVFYVSHILEGKPMHIDNPDEQMGFIRSDEAGYFIAHMALSEFTGPVNGSSEGTVSLNDIFVYIEKKTGKRPILSEDGDEAPYNGETEYSINTEKAKSTGFRFTKLHDWIYDLIDGIIEELK